MLCPFCGFSPEFSTFAGSVSVWLFFRAGMNIAFWLDRRSHSSVYELVSKGFPPVGSWIFPENSLERKITPFRYIKPLLKRVCEWDSKQRRRGRHSIWLLFIMIIITQTFNWVSWSRVRVFHTTTRERGKLSTPGTLETEAASGIWCHYRLASLGRWFSPLRGRRLWFGLKSFLATNTHWITNGGEEREKLFSEQIVQLEDNKCSEGLPAV